MLLRPWPKRLVFPRRWKVSLFPTVLPYHSPCSSWLQGELRDISIMLNWQVCHYITMCIFCKICPFVYQMPAVYKNLALAHVLEDITHIAHIKIEESRPTSIVSYAPHIELLHFLGSCHSVTLHYIYLFIIFFCAKCSSETGNTMSSLLLWPHCTGVSTQLILILFSNLMQEFTTLCHFPFLLMMQ